MLSIDLIRTSSDMVRRAIARRHDDTPLDELLSLDDKRVALLKQAETLRAERNRVSKELSRMTPRPPELIAEMRKVGGQIDALEKEMSSLEAELRQRMLRLPNLPFDRVPNGKDSADNRVVRISLEPRPLPGAKPHWDVATHLGIIDFERGQKISGSRFYILKGPGARLQRALIQWMLDLHSEQHGYEEIYPPFMVREQVLYGAGQLPKFADNLYHDVEEDYWMVPTAEVPLTGMHSGEILPPGTLPLRYVAYTPCFRREKMSAGRDIRGIKRLHQFDKVELYKLVDPATSDAELQTLLNDAETVLRLLDLPYRILQLCTGELGFAAAESYDLETWAPGCNEWLEVSSCSNCTDFQARRADIRYRKDAKSRPEFVHTLNGSGLGLPRVMISILENYQQSDGSLLIPKVLQPYTKFDRITPKTVSS